jgi:nucleoside-diphosphate-sugar epimerase
MSISVSASSATSFSKPVVILGGSGFIGARLTRLLVDQRTPVCIGDIRKSEYFPELWTECDVRRLEPVENIVRGADVIVNLAAEHRDDVYPVSRYYETNVRGASEICSAARRARVQRIVFTSSVAVYGFHSRPVDESGPFSPFNEYGKTKLTAERIYRDWASEDPSRTLVIVRPTVVFGEGNRGNVYNLLRQIASRHFLMVGAGNNTKSMAYVGNVATFLVHALSLPPGEHIFNYVDGPDMTTKRLVEHIRSCMQIPGETRTIPKSIALAGGYFLDMIARVSGKTFPVSAIRVRKFCESTQFCADRVLSSGFTPPYSLREGLARTIQFEFQGR